MGSLLAVIHGAREGCDSMARIVPKNWAEFQHYADRNPSWIKLHKKLLDNYDFHCLPVASRALAPMLWLIASDTKEGIIDAEPKKLGYRLRMTPKEVTDALNPLIEGEFFSVVQDDSDPLAEAERSASLEKRDKEREEKEEKKRALARLFDEFWAVCPKKVALPKARASFLKAVETTLPSVLIEAMAKYASVQAGQDSKFTLHPTTWLNQQRWLDQGEPTKTPQTLEQMRADRARMAALNIPTPKLDAAIAEAEAA